jgi:hypothetical protein
LVESSHSVCANIQNFRQFFNQIVESARRHCWVFEDRGERWPRGDSEEGRKAVFMSYAGVVWLDRRLKVLYKFKVLSGGTMPKPLISRQTARILAMLLRCGMICREELEVVLDIIEGHGAGHPSQAAAGRR